MQVGYRRIVMGMLLLLWPWSGQPLVAEAQRQHRAHVHGAGTLNLVQEGKRVHIELEIPGMDIVGFEHQARTASQKQAVKDAVAVLEQGDALFRLNAEATCALDTAGVEVAMMAMRTKTMELTTRMTSMQRKAAKAMPSFMLSMCLHAPRRIDYNSFTSLCLTNFRAPKACRCKW